MSDCYINWRFGTYHLQIHRNRPWITWEKNWYHVKYPPTKWFERY